MAKTVLITGADGVVGRATAEAFLDDDWTVWATAPEETDLDGLAESGCETATLDVTNARQCERVVGDLVDETGRIDCLVNAAGRTRFGAVEDIPTADLEAQFDATALGAHRMIREVLPHMRARERGTVVTVSGVAGRLTLPGSGSHAAAQAAVEGLHDALRVEASAFGVDAVVVEPGPVETPGGEDAAGAADGERTGAYDWLYQAREDSRLAGVRDAVSVAPETVALTIRDAANASDPAPRYPVGEGAKLLLLARHVPARWRDAAVSVVRSVLD